MNFVGLQITYTLIIKILIMIITSYQIYNGYVVAVILNYIIDYERGNDLLL